MSCDVKTKAIVMGLSEIILDKTILNPKLVVIISKLAMGNLSRLMDEYFRPAGTARDRC